MENGVDLNASRWYVLRTLGVWAAALLLLLPGCATRATFRITHPPRFAETTCVPALPAARAGYPAGSWAAFQAASAANCAMPGRGGSQISSVDFMNTYDKVGGPGPNDRAFQAISLAGVQEQTNADCGDTPVPVIIRVIEYFNLPANDAIALPSCCEELASMSISANVAIVDITELPAAMRAALPAIPAGENAADVDAALNAAQTRDVRQRIQSARHISWGSRWDYDGCHPPPNSTTPCGRGHCLDVTWTDANGSNQQRFSGP